MTGIIIVYMLLIFGVGVWANKYNKGMTDFLLAGRKLGLVLGSFALAATYFGGGFVLGLGGMAYSDGLVSWWFGLGGGIGLIIVGFMAFKLRDLAIYTVPDYLEKRYGGTSIRVLSALLSLIALVGILAAQVLAARSALAIIGLDSMTAAVLAAVIFVTYTAIGGLWAATITDFIQVTIAGIGVFAASIIALQRVGGWGELVSKVSAEVGVPEGFFSLMGTGDLTVILWLTLPMVLYTLIGQDVYQRILATKDPITARNACFLSGILICVLTLFPAILGMSAQAIFPGLEESSLAIPKMLTELFPTLIGGIVLAAILAAIMSTADSILTAGTSHVVNDIYLNTFKRDAEKDEVALLKISRLWTVILGFFAIIVALLIPNIVGVLIMSYTLYTSGVFIPVVGGFLWKKATFKGAMASLLTGIVIAILGLAGVSMGGVPIEILSSVIALVVFVIVSLATYKGETQSV